MNNSWWDRLGVHEYLNLLDDLPEPCDLSDIATGQYELPSIPPTNPYGHDYRRKGSPRISAKFLDEGVGVAYVREPSGAYEWRYFAYHAQGRATPLNDDDPRVLTALHRFKMVLYLGRT